MSALTILLVLAVGGAASLIGGALGGVAIGGKALGNELAALMGGFYGPLAGIRRHRRRSLHSCNLIG